MGLSNTPASERVHIGFFGLMNVGKSSLINAVTAQELSLVSEIPGTTTDPVHKTMEILPLGPVVITDTAGINDSGTLGEMRAARAKKVLDQTDIAVLVTEAGRELCPAEEELIALFREKGIDFVIVRNKADLLGAGEHGVTEAKGTDSDPADAKAPVSELYVSARTGEGVHELKECLASFAKEWDSKRQLLVADLLSPEDITMLVIPIDESAPKGRLILPEQQVMRELLDHHMSFFTCQPEEIPGALAALSRKPALVITDSQAFERVNALVPEEIALTSFSILLARYKGSLQTMVEGANVLAQLKDGDRVLICEGCTHHRQCNDIGTVKLPGWIRQFSGAKPAFDFTSGHGFPEAEDLGTYRLIVHCGGCMINEKEMKSRIKAARAAGVPIVNYGMAIAKMHGILERSLEPFKRT